MKNWKPNDFTQAADAPTVLSVVLEAWWKVAATPGDLVDVLVATAGAGLLTETYSGDCSSQRNAVHEFGGIDDLNLDSAEILD
jgi:hypothetical protein